jgi:hypothetical protein
MELSTYLEDLARARTAETAEAPRLWQRVVEANPVCGEHWLRLAEARDDAGDPAGAVQDYLRALELGAGSPADTAFEIARCFARLGEHESASEWLRRAFAMGYRYFGRARLDGDLADLRRDPDIRGLLGLTDRPYPDRAAAWAHDLRFLVGEVRRKSHHTIRPVTIAEFEASASALAARAVDLSDHQMLVELMTLVATLGDGHARVEPSDGDWSFVPTLPVMLSLFEEGLFVIAAAPEHRDLVGAQVIAFDGQRLADAAERVRPTISRDNEQGVRAMLPYRLREVAVLHALGIAASPDRVTLTLAPGPGAAVRDVEIVADDTWPTGMLKGVRPCPPAWEYLPRRSGRPLARYLRWAANTFWFEELPERQAVYFQLNAVQDAPDESLAALAERLGDVVAQEHVRRLVVDLRWNGGGNTFLVMPLLHRLLGLGKLGRPGGLFVLVGRRTFSAAQNLASLLDRHAQPIFVGEPTGSSPNFVGESVPFTLPYSGTRVMVSDLFWQNGWPMDHRTWIAPHLYVPPTFAALRDNVDPALDAILDLPAEALDAVRPAEPSGITGIVRAIARMGAQLDREGFERLYGSRFIAG